MRLAVLALFLAACATTPHVPADERPKGIPKSARAHCRTEAVNIARDNGGEGLRDDVRQCLDLKLRLDCAWEMLRRAEDLERRGKGDANFFAKFPGVWDRDTLEDELEAMEEAETACDNAKAAAAALALFHGIRAASGGRIPWGERGWGSPGMCRGACPQ